MSQKSIYYTRTAQWLHWLMAIIFIVAYLIGFYSGNFLSYDVDGSFKGNVITLHKNIASVLIFLVVIRIFWRYTHPAPELPRRPDGGQPAGRGPGRDRPPSARAAVSARPARQLGRAGCLPFRPRPGRLYPGLPGTRLLLPGARRPAV